MVLDCLGASSLSSCGCRCIVRQAWHCPAADVDVEHACSSECGREGADGSQGEEKTQQWVIDEWPPTPGVGEAPSLVAGTEAGTGGRRRPGAGRRTGED